MTKNVSIIIESSVGQHHSRIIVTVNVSGISHINLKISINKNHKNYTFSSFSLGLSNKLFLTVGAFQFYILVEFLSCPACS